MLGARKDSKKPRRSTYGSLQGYDDNVSLPEHLPGHAESRGGCPSVNASRSEARVIGIHVSPNRNWLQYALMAAGVITACVATFRVVHNGTSTLDTRPTMHPVLSSKAQDPSEDEARSGSTIPAVIARGNVATLGTTPETNEDGGENSVTLGKVSLQSPELAFVAHNEYTRRGDFVGAGYPWLENRVFVEPHRDTTLEVKDPVKGMTYWWTVMEGGSEGEHLGDFAGVRVELQFGAKAEYIVQLSEQHVSGSLVRMKSERIHCKYVRREIRSLTDAERNQVFDAMKVLWEVDIVAGKQMYGPNYLDVWTINEFHQIGASDRECDHLHDGVGFGITHTMVTTMFENSLRTVNPKLSLPYWDFTIESHLINKNYNGDFTHLRDVSDLFTAEWLGSVDEADYQVKDGRWANLSVPLVEPERRQVLGADIYGRMRSPWNVNDRPFLTRGLGEMCGELSTDFYEWPTCQSHYDLNMMYTSYYGWTWESQYGPHGPVHVWIGGTLDCRDQMDELESLLGSDNMNMVRGLAFLNRKDMFRDGTFMCSGLAHGDTSAEEVMEDGLCGCLNLDLEQGDDYLRVYSNLSNNLRFPPLSKDEQRAVSKVYCNGVVGIGESSQSSSPLDPSFWLLHPTMERLLMFKRLTGTMTDVSWPDEPGTWTDEDGRDYDVLLSLEAAQCFGHRGSDVFPYGIMSEFMTPQFNFWGQTSANNLTNRDIVDMLDPRKDSLPYVYDNFDWSHCLEDGIDMQDVFMSNTSTGDSAAYVDETLIPRYSSGPSVAAEAAAMDIARQKQNKGRASMAASKTPGDHLQSERDGAETEGKYDVEMESSRREKIDLWTGGSSTVLSVVPTTERLGAEGRGTLHSAEANEQRQHSSEVSDRPARDDESARKIHGYGVFPKGAPHRPLYRRAWQDT